MTWSAFFLVFGVSILHAGWNFLSKSKRPSASFYMLASMTSVLICFFRDLILRRCRCVSGSVCC